MAYMGALRPPGRTPLQGGRPPLGMHGAPPPPPPLGAPPPPPPFHRVGGGGQLQPINLGGGGMVGRDGPGPHPIHIGGVGIGQYPTPHPIGRDFGQAGGNGLHLGQRFHGGPIIAPGVGGGQPGGIERNPSPVALLQQLLQEHSGNRPLAALLEQLMPQQAHPVDQLLGADHGLSPEQLGLLRDLYNTRTMQGMV